MGRKKPTPVGCYVCEGLSPRLGVAAVGVVRAVDCAQALNIFRGRTQLDDNWNHDRSSARWAVSPWAISEAAAREMAESAPGKDTRPHRWPESEGNPVLLVWGLPGQVPQPDPEVVHPPVDYTPMTYSYWHGSYADRA